MTTVDRRSPADLTAFERLAPEDQARVRAQEESVPKTPNGLLLKPMPPELYRQLQAAATRERRSLTQQALYILEQALALGVDESPEDR